MSDSAPTTPLFTRPADLLRALSPPSPHASAWMSLLELAGVVLVFGLTYGAVMGTFGHDGVRPL